MILNYARLYSRWLRLRKIKNKCWVSFRLILMRLGRRMSSIFPLERIKFCKLICIIRWNLPALGFLEINKLDIANILGIVDWIVTLGCMNRRDMRMKGQVSIKEAKEIQGLDIVINILAIMNPMIISPPNQESRKVFQKKCTTYYRK